MVERLCVGGCGRLNLILLLVLKHLRVDKVSLMRIIILRRNLVVS